MSHLSSSSSARPTYVGFQSPEKDASLVAAARASYLADPVQTRRAIQHAVANTPPRSHPQPQQQTQYGSLANPRFDAALPSMQVASSLLDDEEDAALEMANQARHTASAWAPSAASTYSAGAASAARPAYSSSKYASPQKATTAPVAAAPSHSSVSASDPAPLLSTAVMPTSIDSAMLPVVHSFLKSLYPADLQSTMPSCELTPYTVHALCQLHDHVAATDERAAILEEDMHEAAKEYAAEATRLQSILSRLGLSPSSLSDSARGHLSTLSSLCQLLALKNVEPATSEPKTHMRFYMCGLIDLRDTYHDSVGALRSLQQLHASSLTHAQRELSLLSELRRMHQSRQTALQRDAAEADTRARQIPYFQVKKKEYDRDVHDIENRLSRAGFNESLSHESLVSLSDEIAQLSRDIEPLDQQLHYYQQLPPDLTLARVRVAEARQQLAELEDQFTQQVQQMHEADGNI